MTLTVDNLVRRFGGLAAVDGVSFQVADGECLGIIGANGSGKTTTINLLTRVDDPTAGAMSIDGVDYTRRPAHHLPRLGIARTFQNLRLFHDLSVEENVKLAATQGGRSTKSTRLAARHLLDAAGMGTVAAALPASLPYGTQRVIEVTRALATEPRVLFLDEPFAGMSTSEAERLGALLEVERERTGLTLVIIDHNLEALLTLVDRLLVFARGTLLASGDPSSVVADPAVVASYIGSHDG